jgi:BirA family biotin operon repressor/biotin-[acetyl-CoA-carboxylase] ligase
VIVGFGINVRSAVYPEELAGRATSLEHEVGREVDRGAVLAECIAAFAARYDDLQHDRGGVVLTTWRRYAQPLLGRAVEWEQAGCVCDGIAEGIDDGGALLVRTRDGVSRVIAGDVRWT